MATTTTLYANASAYGTTSRGAFAQANGSHIYVGKDGTTYRSRLRFPSLRAAAGIGQSMISISSMILYMRRDDGDGGNRGFDVGFSTSSAWGAYRNPVVGGWATSSDGVKAVDVTAFADSVKDYDASWFAHLYSDYYRMRFDACHGSADYVPRIVVTWEYVANTIKTEVDRATIGESVTFNITPEENDATFTLAYSVGDMAEVIVEKTAETSIDWVIPLGIASEYPNDIEGSVTITMTVYDANDKVVRTELLYLTVDVPDTLLPIVSNISWFTIDGLNDYVLANKSRLSISPIIDMNDTYGSTIASIKGIISDGENVQNVEWSSFVESDPGVFECEPIESFVLTMAGEAIIDVIVTDSRGRTVTKQEIVNVLDYHFPIVSEFAVDRYEPVYDNDETIVGYEISDTGEYVFVTINANVKDISPEGTSLNRLYWELKSTVVETGETATYTGGGESTIASIIQDRTIVPDSIGTANTIEYALTVYDSSGSIIYQYDDVAPGRANFALAGNKYGAAFGGLPQGTPDNPMLESYYPFHAYGKIYARNGVEGVVGTYPKPNNPWGDPATGEEQFTGDYWYDGKPIYRRTAEGYLGTTSAIHFQNLGPVGAIVRMYGYTERVGTGIRYPINFWYSTSVYTSVWIGDNTTGALSGRVSPAGQNIFVVIEFTKPD